VKNTSHLVVARTVVIAFCVAALCSGCVSGRLRALEEQQLVAELAEIGKSSTYLSSSPVLGTAYAARAFISSRALNEALDGYSEYVIPLKSPSGATVTVKNVDLEFRDGMLGLMVQAEAVNKQGDIRIKLRVRVDLIIEVNAASSTLSVRPLVRELVPDIKVSIFRFREFWFAHRLLLIPAQEYVDALPAIQTKVDLDFAVSIPGGERRETIKTPDGTISIKFDTPAIHREFKYAVSQVLHLKEGLYLFVSGGAQ
jgi:hypothetical protein